MRRLLAVLCALSVLTLTVVPQLYAQGESQRSEQIECHESNLYCPVSSAKELGQTLEALPTPKVTAPPAPVTPSTSVRKPITRAVTYDVTTRGTITADFATFKSLANATLNDNRGWSRLGVKFTEVASGGSFTLVLSEASQVPTFGSPCDSSYSCRVGRYVIINQDRWQTATPSWNSGGGSLRDYRHMVVNHEVGHWLGHGHEKCSGAGQPAAVMQQQSIDLQGCVFNAWPLDSEIWSSRLGI
ncbi:MAG: DUF3152 domain-containing protein [Candidatus Saccharimonadales bacterium]